MLALNSPTEVKPLRLPCIICALGVFDGLHLGHRKVIEAVVRNARDTRGTSTIITFDKHPYTVLNPSYELPLLTAPSKKLELLDGLGIDVCILMRFNKSIASVTAENWIKEILWGQLHIKGIYIGQDSFFGRNREGNAELLSQWGNRLGFSVNIIETVRINRVPVSSTLIRNNIGKGHMDLAGSLLGRPYSVLGTVVKGTGRGRKLGFPTANLDTGNQYLPLDGVYAVRVNPVRDKTPEASDGCLRQPISNGVKVSSETISRPATDTGGQDIPAVANIGRRPTFTSRVQEQTKPMLEVHLLEDTGETCRKEMEVMFIKRLREEKRFASASLLAQQIQKDVASARQILSH